MKKKVIIILISIVLIGAIGGAYAYYMFQKPVKDFTTSKSEIVLEAKAIYNDFINDEIAANAKYVAGDKTIEVTGKISEINKLEDGSVTLILDVEDPDGGLSCSLTPESDSGISKYSAGSKITIKGQCTGFQELISKEVIMIRCGIVD